MVATEHEDRDSRRLAEVERTLGWVLRGDDHHGGQLQDDNTCLLVEWRSH